jgi:hypothetical protein
MSINIPVYYYINEGVWKLPGYHLSVHGRFVNPDPMEVPVDIYLMYEGHLILAPITKEFLTQLFGNKYFASAKFELSGLHILAEPFLRKLADKVGIKHKHLKSRSGIARLIRNEIQRKIKDGSKTN